MRRLLGAWSPARRPTGPRPPSGPRSTPAWCRRRRWTARRSSRPRGSARPSDLHPVQHEMAVRGGSQCGYCTPGFVCSMAAEFYRSGRASRQARNGTGPHDDQYHGENGFDLHAISGNLCRCTGYRPIKDAAYALGFPAADDDLATRRTAARARTGRHPAARRRGGVPAPGDPGRGPAAAARPRGRRGGRRQHRLGRRRQPQGRPGRAGGRRSTGSPSCAASRSDPDGRESGSAPALTLTEVERRLDGRLPLLARPDAAVRLTPDPQRRHPRRQPRHRLADRRRPTGAARARGVGRARLRPRGSGRCRWRSTSPATASPYAAPAS